MHNAFTSVALIWTKLSSIIEMPTQSHRTRTEKRWSVTTRAPRSRELPSTCTPRANHRRPIRSVLATARAENAEEHGWGARVDQKLAETCRSGFQNQKKNSEKTGQKSHRRHFGLAPSPKKKS
jgi:hypothetical protein